MGGPTYIREAALLAGKARVVAGVDEAGRGPLAGPVAAAAVVLDANRIPAGLDDSKLLGEGAREELFASIMADAVAVGVALVPASTIDRINIRQATLLAMRRAVAALAVRPDHVLIDGNDLPTGLPCPADFVIGGDGLCASIAAASIIAKVTRDRLMRRLGVSCPAYSFEIHKGYGTSLHRASIAAHGPSVFHRMSFSPFKNGTP